MTNAVGRDHAAWLLLVEGGSRRHLIGRIEAVASVRADGERVMSGWRRYRWVRRKLRLVSVPKRTGGRSWTG